MNFLLRLWGILTTIPQRLAAQFGLVLAAIVGLVSSISLILSIPLYADSVYYRSLQESVADQTVVDRNARPPFSFLFHFYGDFREPVNWEELAPLDSYLPDAAANILGLPQKHLVTYISTNSYPLFPTGDVIYSDQSKLTRTSFGFMENIEDHITLVEGNFPAPLDSPTDDPIHVAISKNLADEIGFQVGEEYLAFISDEWESGEAAKNQIAVRVAGIWEPADPDEEYWISEISYYDRVLFLPRETFLTNIDPSIEGAVYSAYYFFIMDGSNVFSDDVKPLLRRINTIERQVDNILDGTRLAVSPADDLTAYQQAADSLTILLYAFSVPIIGLILAFIGLVSRLSIERQRNEIAVLRSRGATPFQVLGFTIMEGVVLGLVSLGISFPVAFQLTKWITRTRSFLDFSSDSTARLGISSEMVQIGFLAVFLMLVAVIIPAVGASRYTIVSYKKEVGRTAAKPWWQRTYMDVLLFIPAAYGTYLLQQQGSVILLDETGRGDFFDNPLLFLVPALAIFAVTLFSLRLVQPVMSVVARIAGISKNAGLTLAARQLSRSPGNYFTPLIILILTVSLSSYTASLAFTLDQHLYDQKYYQIGADLRFVDAGDSSAQSESAFAPQQNNEPQTWTFIPVFEYLKITGVQAAARLGKFSAQADTGSGSSEGWFFGVDRVDFPQAVYWRDDFASESLGSLMNRLALDTSGVLVPNEYLVQNNLKVGDPITLRVAAYGNVIEIDVNVVGGFTYFPMWYPEDGPLFVGNLEYLYELMGGTLPYRVLIRADENFDPTTIGQDVSLSTISALNADTPITSIIETQEQPERQGLFGFLFIGFATAALLTALAFLLYVLFSFRQRFIELGVLRAAGLSIPQMTSYLVWELAFMIIFGGIIGTVLGYWASNLYIPFLQIGSEAADLIPPFQILIAWPMIKQIYWMFAGLFGVTLIILVVLLRRMRIFQAIKLGETV